jgi:hypothetical protein
MTQPDTIVPDPANPQDWNRYSYARNNPLKYTDPTGHRPIIDEDENGNPIVDPDWHPNRHNDRKGNKAENLPDMLGLALAGADTIVLTGDALVKIQDDPAFRKFQGSILMYIYGNPNFRKESFVFPRVAQDEDGKPGIKFGGARDPSSMLMQLISPNSKEYSETWAAANNELTWMLRHANLSADVWVTVEGEITINYSLDDQLDLTPDWKHRSLEYNVATTVLGEVWHNVMGASKPKVYANWTAYFSDDNFILPDVRR